MNALIHVISSDITHHSKTLLQFFNDTLANTSVHARKFMIVNACVCKDALSYPRLIIDSWSDKASLARAVVEIAKVNRKQKFFFHGQFNSRLWLALLRRKIYPAQFNWHVWGADLYETSCNWKFRLFYPIRRIAQKNVGCVFATCGDLYFFKKFYPKIRSELLYFPTRMNVSLDKKTYNKIQKRKLTILVGNSGDRSNEHIVAIKAIHKQFGNTVKLVIPMGYPNKNGTYISQVYKKGRTLFSAENFYIIDNTLEFSIYKSLLKKCDLGYFIFARQQGIGTISLLVQAGVPCALNYKNPFWKDMVGQGIPLLFTNNAINEELIRNVQKQLEKVDKRKISFFYPNYITLWHRALRVASGDMI